MKPVDSFASQFHHAFHHKTWDGGLEPSISNLSIEQAYDVQELVTQMRINGGDEVVGFKVGCTSEAIRSQFGLDSPISARLFKHHVREEGIGVNWRDYVNCAIEPEMVFKIGVDLRGEQTSDDQLIDAIEYVSPGIEIHNYRFWHTPPTAQELICSGGIHAGLIIGNSRVAPRELSFKNEMFSVYQDGVMTTKGPASEIMGGPLESLRWLIRFLTKKGHCLKAGSLVIPGSPVELISIQHDTELRIEIERVGALTANFKDTALK